jgi:hypothetical protein
MAAKQCTAKRRDGTACKGRALKDDGFCLFHSTQPDIIRRRTRGRRTGGRRAHASPKVLSDAADLSLQSPADVTALLSETISQLRRGQIEAKIASGVGYLCTVLLAAMEQSSANEPPPVVQFHFDEPEDKTVPHDPHLEEYLTKHPN